MKQCIRASLFALIVLLALGTPLVAQSAAGNLDLSAKPLALSTRVPADQLHWLNQVFGLMASSDFTFIYRTDPDHWMGLYRERLVMTFHVHDGSAGFNFRATVDRSSGALTALRATSFEGRDRAQSAEQSAQLAVGYLARVLANPEIFATDPKALLAASHGDGPVSKGPVLSSERSPAGAVDPLSRLLEGNARFVAGKMLKANQTPGRRAEVAKGQKPFAIVLTCADSRLPPELIFDQGLGDLFVVRTAGEVVGDLEVGSIEYAAEHLGATHLIIMGHERCGAVDATIQGGHASDAISRILFQIQPAVALAKGLPGDLLDNAIRQNVLLVKKAVMRSPVIEDLMHEKKLTVSTAYYDLDSGMVSLIDASEAAAASGAAKAQGAYAGGSAAPAGH